MDEKFIKNCKLIYPDLLNEQVRKIMSTLKGTTVYELSKCLEKSAELESAAITIFKPQVFKQFTNICFRKPKKFYEVYKEII